MSIAYTAYCISVHFRVIMSHSVISGLSITSNQQHPGSALKSHHISHLWMDDDGI